MFPKPGNFAVYKLVNFKVATAMVLSLLTGTAALATVPTEKPNYSWISVSGTVVSAADESFMLDYGEGVIKIEMDDWDWYKEAAMLIDGDKVTVYGRVDNDLYENKTIEASSVYVKNLNSYFYASPEDEEDWRYRFFNPPAIDSWIEMTGVITDINIPEREFTLDTGNRKLTVNTRQMTYNPLDKLGFQELKIGDYIRVAGEMDYDLFEKREVIAKTIVTLVKDTGKSASG